MKQLYEYLLSKKNKSTDDIDIIPLDDVLYKYGCSRIGTPMSSESNGITYVDMYYSFDKKLVEKFHSNIGEAVSTGWVNLALNREGKIDTKKNTVKVLVDKNYVHIEIIDSKHFIDKAKLYNKVLGSIYISVRDKRVKISYTNDELLETLTNVIEYLLEKFNIDAEVETYHNRKKHK